MMDNTLLLDMPVGATLGRNSEIWDLFTLKGENCGETTDYRPFYTATDDMPLTPRASKFLSEQGMSVEYPGHKKFAVFLSHDVDDIYPPLSHVAFSSVHTIKRLDAGGLASQWSWRLRGKANSPYRNFRDIMALEERYGATSSFFTMATDRDIRPFRTYRVEDLESDLGEIADRGWEVGLHGGYYAFDDPGEIKREKVRLEAVLGKKVIGYRNHYLRLKVPDTWRYLARAGFEYDSTLGYSNALGFRNGMCHPFRPYDTGLGREIGLCEIPLSIMDGTLFRHYRSPAEMWSAAKAVVDAVEKYNGVVTLLWHNNMFSAPYRIEWKKMYVKLLEYCRSKNAWMASGKEVYEHWRNGYRT